MSYGKSCTFETIREKAYGDITNLYTVLGGVTTKLGRAVKITNNTDITIYISDDGTNNKLKLPANSFETWDLTSNSPDVTNQFLPKGTQFYVKYATAPSSGYVSVEILTVASGL